MRALVVAAILGWTASGCSVPIAPVGAGEAGCTGLSAEICRAVVDAMAATGSSEVIGFRVRCTEAACGHQSGSVDIEVAWSDGTRTSSNLAWANGFDAAEARALFGRAGMPIPTPPVPPLCIGVPADECHSSWVTAMENVAADRIDDVVRVTVECMSSTPCTSTSGSGRVTLQFRDGTSRIESTWGYADTL